jgi:hypothetical protein
LREARGVGLIGLFTLNSFLWGWVAPMREERG